MCARARMRARVRRTHECHRVYGCMNVLLYVFCTIVWICGSINTWMDVDMYAYMFACMHTCMPTCMHMNVAQSSKSNVCAVPYFLYAAWTVHRKKNVCIRTDVCIRSTYTYRRTYTGTHARAQTQGQNALASGEIHNCTHICMHVCKDDGGWNRWLVDCMDGRTNGWMGGCKLRLPLEEVIKFSMHLT